MTLRKETIRLAHTNPEIRSHLLPLLKEASASLEEELAEKIVSQIPNEKYPEFHFHWKRVDYRLYWEIEPDVPPKVHRDTLYYRLEQQVEKYLPRIKAAISKRWEEYIQEFSGKPGYPERPEYRKTISSVSLDKVVVKSISEDLIVHVLFDITWS